MNVLNKYMYILGHDGLSVNLDCIGRSHIFGRLAASSYSTQRPRDIIVQFNLYRDRANVFSRKEIVIKISYRPVLTTSFFYQMKYKILPECIIFSPLCAFNEARPPPLTAYIGSAPVGIFLILCYN